MNNQNKRILVIGMIIAVLALLFTGKNCYIEFTASSTDIVAHLLSFGILAILIERFTNSALINVEYKNYISALRTPGIKAEENTRLDHRDKFNWNSFLLGVIVSALGFRFFENITELTEGCADRGGLFAQIDFNWAYNIVDIFFTGILLSGGSQLIFAVIEWFTKDNT